MVNTGNGENESTTGKPVTVENSSPSPTPEKKRMRKTEEPTTPAEAGELLLSALDYCKKAGLKVEGYNDPAEGGLVLLVMGLEYTGTKIVPLVTPTVTPIPAPVESVTP